MEFTSYQLEILNRRYLKGETPEQMMERVAKNIANGDQNKQKSYYKLMDQNRFWPNSPTLMNAGRELQQLSACFVIPINDSIEDIFDAVKYAALIHKSGGGTGFSFSRLRPRGDSVGSTGGGCQRSCKLHESI